MTHKSLALNLRYLLEYSLQMLDLPAGPTYSQNGLSDTLNWFYVMTSRHSNMSCIHLLMLPLLVKPLIIIYL